MPRTAHADDGSPPPSIHWDPAWTHAGTADYALTGIGAAALGVELVVLQPNEPALRWTGPILFDRQVRDLLRGDTQQVRLDALTTSWVMLGVLGGYVLSDVVYAWTRYGPTVANDLFWQDATALSLATVVDIGLRDAVGRARPPISDCLEAGGGSACLANDTEATRSFPGGHMAVATTAAVLTCTQHLKLELYGGPWDGVACAAAITTDAAVGTLRIVSDSHWTSDVLVGGVLGVGFGWGVPVLMHLHGHAPAAVGEVTVVPTPLALPHGGGLGVQGSF